MKRVVIVVCALPVVLLALNAIGQQPPARNETARRFIGTWRLVSIVAPNGQPVPNRGSQPTGLIYYDAGGNMSVQIMPDRLRSKWTGTPTPDQAKSAVEGYTAYFGTYTIDERAQTVTHHLKGSINPGSVGADFVRRYEFHTGDRFTLSAVPVENANRLTWERIK